MRQLVNLTPANLKYYNDEHRFIVVTAGRRSRKTLIGSRKLLLRALEESRIEKGRSYFHGAPTHQQAKSIFWDRLKKDVKSIMISKSETELTVKLINDITIKVVGLDKPERLEGTPWHGGHITEYDNVKAHAWAENLRPLFSDTKGWCIFDGVPEGKKQLYDKALFASNNVIPVTLPNVGAYADNEEWSYHSWFSADVLDAMELEAVKNELDERTFKQEYEGAFEDIEGLAYYAFGNHNLKPVEYNPNYPVSIGMDFNVNPMTAIMGHIYNNEFHQFDELFMTNSNTYETGRYIKEKYGTHNVTIFPDATGEARESNATESDLAILRNYGFTVRANSVNPYVKDRINAVNSLMRSSNGNVRYFVNPKTCQKTVNDFNRVERLPDGRENKKQEAEGLIHISSALGYLIAYNFPFNRGRIYA